MNVKLNRKQRDTLVNLVLPETSYTSIGGKIVEVRPGKFSLQIDPGEAKGIRVLCMERFQEIGIGEDSEPNEVGLILEDLTDLFFTG